MKPQAKPAVNKLSKLQKLKEKLSKEGSSSKGYFNAKEGANVIRILPDVGDMEYFYQVVGRHELADNKWAYCPNVTSDGELPCPICEFENQLWKSGDKDGAKKMRVSKKYWMNVIDRSNEDAGPMVMTAGITILQALANLINDPDYGELYDIKSGFDVTLTKKGKGMETRYEVVPKPKVTPLHADPAIVKAWLEKAKDLSFVELSENSEEDEEITAGKHLWVYPYNRIISQYNLDFDEMVVDEEEYEEEEIIEEEEEEEEPAPVKSNRVVRKHTR